MKTKYFNLNLEDITASYDVKIDTKNTVPYIQKFVEWHGHKYWCRKISDEDWTITEIDEFPFAELPIDFTNLNQL